MPNNKVNKKLRISKLTIQNLDHNQVTLLESDEQKVVKAGSDNQAGSTVVPIYCKP